MLKFALRNLMSRPARSALAVVGLTVAITGMIGLFSVAGGLAEMVADTFGRIKGLVAMQPGAPIPLFSRLPASWGAEIARVPGVAIVTPEIWTRANVIDGKAIVNPPRFLFGTDIPSRMKLTHGVYQQDIVAGRFLLPADQGTDNAVVSRPIAEEFHKTVGDHLNVNGRELTIVGIYFCDSFFLDVAIILDIGEVRGISRFGSDAVCSFYIEQDGTVDDRTLIQRIQTVFKGRETPPWQPSSAQDSASTGLLVRELLQRLVLGSTSSSTAGSPPGSTARSPGSAQSVHPAKPAATHENKTVARGGATTTKPSIAPAKSPSAAAGTPTAGSPLLLPIEVRSATEWASRFEEFTADLNVILTILSGIGVTIAVLSIVNTMLMSVAERIIEFGILKANGWSRSDVLRLITSESAVLGFCGGVSGCVLAVLAIRVINTTWPTRVHLMASPGLLLFGLLFSTFLGIAGGLYPAIWAMRMMPMEAIRRG